MGKKKLLALIGESRLLEVSQKILKNNSKKASKQEVILIKSCYNLATREYRSGRIEFCEYLKVQMKVAEQLLSIVDKI